MPIAYFIYIEENKNVMLTRKGQLSFKRLGWVIQLLISFLINPFTHKSTNSINHLSINISPIQYAQPSIYLYSFILQSIHSTAILSISIFSTSIYSPIYPSTCSFYLYQYIHGPIKPSPDLSINLHKNIEAPNRYRMLNCSVCE